MSGNTHSIGYYRSAPLVVQYFGPTAGGRGARLIVRSDADGRRVSVPYRYDLNTDDRVTDAVSQWIDIHGQHLPSASWVIVSTGSASWLAVPLVGRAVVSDDDRVTLVVDGYGDENHKCADCFGVFDTWAEEAPGFRLCVECCAERVETESGVEL